eukprot:gene15658-23902_t
MHPLAQGLLALVAGGVVAGVLCLQRAVLPKGWQCFDLGVSVTRNGALVVRTAKGKRGITATTADEVTAGAKSWTILLGDDSLGKGAVPDWVGVTNLRGIMGNPNSVGLAGSGGVWRGGKLLRKAPHLLTGQIVTVRVDGDKNEAVLTVDNEQVARVELNAESKPYKFGILLHEPGEAAVLLDE